jgi:single-strand DNA-binding protein
MPLNYNKVTVAGTLTRDPEIKYTPKGLAIAEIGMAINHVYHTDAGEKREEVTFVDITCFGKTAEVIGKHSKKGHCILIDGHLRLESWDDKQSGQKRSKLKIIGDHMSFVSRPARDKGEGEGEEPGEGKPSSPPPRRPAAPPPRQQDPDLDQPEDDIPF